MNPSGLIVPLLLIGLLVLLFSRTRRQQRQAQQLQSGLAIGAQIVTTAGLYATVVEVDGAVVTLETGPGQRSRWDRRAVARVLPDQTGVADADTSDVAVGREEEAVEPRLAGSVAETAEPSPDTAPPDRG